MPSLQDQLLKAGVIDPKKAKDLLKQSRKESKQQLKQAPKGKKFQSESQQLAQKTLAEKANRDRELNKQQQAQAEEKAIAAQIKQLIESNRINHENGDRVYQFTDNKKIKKLYVNSQQHNQLSRGYIAIVRLEHANLDSNYEIVPAAVAEKIRQRHESCVVMLNDSAKSANNAPDPNDPYADFQIPDDLMW